MQYVNEVTRTGLDLARRAATDWDLQLDPEALIPILHAGNAPDHGSTFEAYVLHYTDYFSADHAMIQNGGKPHYQK